MFQIYLLHIITQNYKILNYRDIQMPRLRLMDNVVYPIRITQPTYVLKLLLHLFFNPFTFCHIRF